MLDKNQLAEMIQRVIESDQRGEVSEEQTGELGTIDVVDDGVLGIETVDGQRYFVTIEEV